MSAQDTKRQANSYYQTQTPKRPTLSVVTATYNVEAQLPHLIQSLQAQTDLDFEWVVADGASTDGTLHLLEEAAKTLNVRIDSCNDFGIYDALNRAIKIATGDYYIVMGADDVLFPAAVSEYRAACQQGYPGLVTAKIELDGIIRGVRKVRWEWLNGMESHISGHAVGLAIRRDLHERYGWYAKSLAIAADQVFVLRALHGGCGLYEADFVAGRFSTTGLSGSNRLGAIAEKFQSQTMTGHNVILQLALFNYRILKLIIKAGLNPYSPRAAGYYEIDCPDDAPSKGNARDKD